MSKHTPGPWGLVGNFNVVGASRERTVATCGGYSDNRPGTFDENCANARLIAAAPEMLGALKACLRQVQTIEHVRIIEAAIAKAEGRT